MKKEQTPSEKLQELVNDAEYEIEAAKKAENDIQDQAKKMTEQAK